MHIQAIQVLGGEVTQFVADPRKGFTEEVQVAGKAISLFSIAQVMTHPCARRTALWGKERGSKSKKRDTLTRNWGGGCGCARAVVGLIGLW